MAQTLTTLRTLLTYHSAMLDNYIADDASLTDANRDTQLNWALRDIGKRLFLFHPKITLNLVADQAEYNLRDVATPVVSRKVLVPHVVYIAGNPLYGYGGTPGVYGIGQLQHERKTYLTETSGTPTIAAFFNQSKLWLSPPPSTVGTNNYIAGTYLPADMVNDNDVPDIPEELHEAIAYSAAVKAALPSLTEGEQWQKVAAYNAEWGDAVARMAKANASALDGPWDDAGWTFPSVVQG